MNTLLNTDQDDTQIDENADFVSILTGPGAQFDKAKFNDETEMWKAIAKKAVHADRQITNLTKSQNELRTDYREALDRLNSGPKLQEYLDKILEKQQSLDKDTHMSSDSQEKPGLDPKELDSLISQKFQQLDTERREQSNFNSVKEKLQEVHGSNYGQVLKQQISNLGLTEDFVNDMAKKSPQALLKLLDAPRNQESFQAPPQSTSRTQLDGKPAGRTWSYYQELRKKDPHLYHSPKIQDQLMKDAVNLGDKFQDGDWSSWNSRTGYR